MQRYSTDFDPTTIEPLPAGLSRRAFVGRVAATLAPLSLQGCGGGAIEPATSAAQAELQSGVSSALASNSAKSIATAQAVTNPAIKTSTSLGFTSLQLTSSFSGTSPYSATVMPLRGQVPAGSLLTSDDDATLACSVFSTWDDGSAAIIVASGSASLTAGVAKTVQLKLEAKHVETRPALTIRDIAERVRSIEVSCLPDGAAARTDFTRPDRIWWANSNVICARYRNRMGSHASLEAVMDIHAYSTGDVFVEVVLENCRMDTATPVWPSMGVYTGASIKVNGNNIIDGVSAAACVEGQHIPFRAWYASGSIGKGTAVRATQSHIDLQKHPLLFKMARNGSSDLTEYASDQYRPWRFGRHRPQEMGSTGDHPSIGPIPQWEARFLQTGDARAANAVEASCLSVLSYNVNYRDSTTGFVPGFVEIGARDQQGNLPAWLRMTNPANKGAWEQAHHPASGLMAFIVRPSPVFMEVAQKIAVWNGTWSGANEDSFAWTSGTHGYWYQMRGRAWCLRSLTHATFLTPRDMSWRKGGEAALFNNTVLFNAWKSDSWAKLNTMWDYLPRNGVKDGAPDTGFQTSMWGYHFLLPELHKAASARLLGGAEQALLDSVADWACMQPVRWINEQPNGGWRYIPYQTTMGRNPQIIDSCDTWGEQMAWYYTNQPSSVSGAWYVFDGAPPREYSDTGENARAGAYYPSYLWAALVAAVERDVPGARQAWRTVQTQLTTLPTWLDGFGVDPRWGAYPRNV